MDCFPTTPHRGFVGRVVLFRPASPSARHAAQRDPWIVDPSGTAGLPVPLRRSGDTGCRRTPAKPWTVGKYLFLSPRWFFPNWPETFRAALILRQSVVSSGWMPMSALGRPTLVRPGRIGHCPVMNASVRAVQLCWPYQSVNSAPSLAIRSDVGRPVTHMRGGSSSDSSIPMSSPMMTRILGTLGFAMNRRSLWVPAGSMADKRRVAIGKLSGKFPRKNH